jgi:cytidyltransferase-like protein
MHSGHYNLFRMARMLCDELVVGVHSAHEIEKTKGCPPVQTDEERMRLVGSVKSGDTHRESHIASNVQGSVHAETEVLTCASWFLHWALLAMSAVFQMGG